MRFNGPLAIAVLMACACDLNATRAETPQTATAKVVLAILGPKEGLLSAKFEKIQAAAEKLIRSLLPAAAKDATQDLGLRTDLGVSIKLNPIPDSLVFELYSTAPDSNIAVSFANNVAGQLVQALPKADHDAIQQLESEIGMPPVLLILESAKPSPVTMVRR